MGTSKQQQQKKFMTPLILSIMVLLISVAAFVISEILFDWYWNDMLIFIAPIVLVLLLPFLIKFGYMSRSNESYSTLRLILTIVAIVLLSIPVACFITTSISREQVINGSYSLEETGGYSPNSTLSTLRWCSILICIVVFSMIAICFWKSKNLHNTITKSKLWMFFSVTLLTISSIFVENFNSDNSWYYRSEQTLLTDSRRYYNDAVASYKLCCPHIDIISKAYDKYLSNQLIDTVFWLSKGNTPVITLQQKDAKYNHLKNVLTAYTMGWADNERELQKARNDLARLRDCEKRFREPLAKQINVSKLEDYSADMQYISDRLEKMDFNSMSKPKELSQRTEDLIAIVELIKDVTMSFKLYYRAPTITKYSVVTWDAQEKRQIIDERLKAFNAKYHFE